VEDKIFKHDWDLHCYAKFVMKLGPQNPSLQSQQASLILKALQYEHRAKPRRYVNTFGVPLIW